MAFLNIQDIRNGASSPTFASSNSGYTNLSGALNNVLTGNTDWTRQLESQQIAQNFTAEQLAKEREFNASEAQKLRNWQTEMSNSAYSRAIADLKKNGINPYISISGMSAASTPTGSAATSGYGVGNVGRSPVSPQGFNNLLNSAFNLASKAISVFGKK